MVLLLCLLLLAGPTVLKADDAISHSFFSARSSYTAPIAQFVHSAALLDETIPCSSSLEATVYYSQTTNPEKIARFFLPFGLQQLHVMEYKPGVLTSDLIRNKTIEARNFNIQTKSSTSTFESIVNFTPEEKVTGLCFQGTHVIKRRENGTPRIWLSYTLPIERVSRTMGLKEEVVSTGGGKVDAIGLDTAPRVGTMTEAFRQPNWNYGKMDNLWHRATGIADILVELGWSSCWNRWCHTSSFFGAVIPTGTEINQKQQEFVFAPVVGNNHHWALQYGTEVEIGLIERDFKKLRFIYQAKGMVIAGNCQVRSFDLNDVQWARYLELYRSQAFAQEAFTMGDANAGTSGINVFTKAVRVSPRTNSSLTGSLAYQHNNWELEGGYHVFMRHSELVHLPRWNERVAIKNITGQGTTNIARTIDKNFPGSAITAVNDFTEALVGVSQINFDSMAHPAVVDQTFFGTLAYLNCHWRAGFGASYQFSSTNTTLDHWTIWGTLGVSW